MMFHMMFLHIPQVLLHTLVSIPNSRPFTVEKASRQEGGEGGEKYLPGVTWCGGAHSA